MNFPGQISRPGFVQVQDSGIYEVKCPSGHIGLTLLQNHKFEILFEIGVLAYFDGYFREAITSFACARERYFEYYIDVISKVHNISPPELEKTWKLIPYSERQYGAFVMAHLFHTKTTFGYVDEKMTKLRNEVVHNGFIPSASDVIAFGEFVYNPIVKLTLDLKASHQNEMTSVLSDEQKSRFDLAKSKHSQTYTAMAKAGIGPQTLAMPFALEVIKADFGKNNFAQEMIERKKMYP
jgi:hypothetical protein